MSARTPLAVEFAGRIKAAATFYRVQKASGRSFAEAVAYESFDAALREVLSDIGGVIYTLSKTAASDADKKSLCTEIDEILGLSPGTLWIIKESSIKSQVAYQTAVTNLLMTLGK